MADMMDEGLIEAVARGIWRTNFPDSEDDQWKADSHNARYMRTYAEAAVGAVDTWRSQHGCVQLRMEKGHDRLRRRRVRGVRWTR